MIRINTACRCAKDQHVSGYRLQPCAMCGQSISVIETFPNTEPVYCLECSNDIEGELIKELINAETSQNKFLALTPILHQELYNIWDMLRNASFEKAEAALMRLPMDNAYVLNAKGVCLLSENKIRKAVHLFSKLVFENVRDSLAPRQNTIRPEVNNVWIANYALCLFYLGRVSAFSQALTLFRRESDPRYMTIYGSLIMKHNRYVFEKSKQDFFQKLFCCKPECTHIDQNNFCGWCEAEFAIRT